MANENALTDAEAAAIAGRVEAYKHAGRDWVYTSVVDFDEKRRAESRYTELAHDLANDAPALLRERERLLAELAKYQPPHPEAKIAWLLPPVIRKDYPLDEDEFAASESEERE